METVSKMDAVNKLETIMEASVEESAETIMEASVEAIVEETPSTIQETNLQPEAIESPQLTNKLTQLLPPEESIRDSDSSDSSDSDEITLEPELNDNPFSQLGKELIHIRVGIYGILILLLAHSIRGLFSNSTKIL